eukprot:TRINITY_DN10320_c0_g1_i1.p1 TRINITY_DN10320_c0_g1~~TRINITY_DN10320_c0_g1_i1.p1  ORF type:complete len:253 (+),score=66.51 TRINITY_DN10320_c0_g1_i1:36-761(+)
MDFLSILLLHICMASCGFTIITMASTDSLFAMSGGAGTGSFYSSCGLFTCRALDKVSMKQLNSGCDGGMAVAVTMEVMAVLTVVILFVPYCIHIMQAMSRGALISYSLAKICRRLHLLSMLTSLFVWILMVVYYKTPICASHYTATSTACKSLLICRKDSAIADQYGRAEAGYGIYLMAGVSVMEFIAFMICMAEKDTWSSVLVKPRPDNDIGQSLINTPIVINTEMQNDTPDPVVPPLAE